MKGKLGVLATVLILLLTNSSTVFATLGPVHVELNMIKPRISAARANQSNSFKIYFRYNINIKIHDWIKIWFPIDECVLSQNPKDVVDQICDGLPKIDEKIDNPRFVPNDEFFKRYPNSKLSGLKQLYTLKDERGGLEFVNCPSVADVQDWGSVCSQELPKTRVIKDPSGLGCWMLGTVFPSLPIDQVERMEKLKTIIRSTPIGYSPCGESQGYPIIVNTCKERLYSMNTPLEIDAWRKGYNSMDVNTSKTTGILSPATPGRYRISIATLPEPVPVESEAFTLPCSDVSNVTLEDNFLDVAGKILTVNFKTGEGGALDGGSSTIKLKLPPIFTIPAKFPQKTIRINGAFVSSPPKVDSGKDSVMLEMIVPTDVNNLGTAKIEFLENSGIAYKPTKEPLSVELSTSSEPNFMKSNQLSLASNPATVVNPKDEYRNSMISCKAILPDGEKLSRGTEVTLNIPEGFTVPKTIAPANVSVMGITAKIVTVSKNSIKITLPSDLEYFVAVTVRNEAGITNPKAGTYSFSITTPKGTYGCGQVEITPTKGFLDNLTLSDYQGSKESRYRFTLLPFSRTPLEVGDIFRIEFPEGTVLPKEFDLAKVTVNDKTAISTGVNGQTLAIATPVEVTSVKPATVSIDIGIRNPRKHGTYKLTAYIGQEEPIVSEEYTIQPSPLKSWIYFKDPDKPNCGDWFNTPPILGFDCLNPDAKITFWFNNQPDKYVYYGGEARMMPGSQRAKITWQAEFNGVKEEPQSYHFNLDSVPPSLSLNYPKTNTCTSASSFFVSGERGYYEMLTDGDNEKYQVTDSVFVRFEGKETQLLQGEIYETANERSIEFKFQMAMQLKEGPNVIEVIARDQACNETIIKRVVTLDTIAPNLEILNPKEGEEFTEGDLVLVRVKTEESATVYIDKTLATLEKTEGDSGIFISEVSLDDGKNIFEVSAKDQCGNTTSMSVVIKAKPKKTIITLTLDKTAWTVNGVDQSPLKTVPTSTFTDPKHKTLNGTTFLPIKDIADYLDCTVTWNAAEKKMTLHQQYKTIECWLNKTTARIDGKEVKYNEKGTIFPVSINGKTMLPLRFVAENLGASVTFDSKTKQITLTYPK